MVRFKKAANRKKSTKKEREPGSAQWGKETENFFELCRFFRFLCDKNSKICNVQSNTKIESRATNWIFADYCALGSYPKVFIFMIWLFEVEFSRARDEYFSSNNRTIKLNMNTF